MANPIINLNKIKMRHIELNLRVVNGPHRVIVIHEGQIQEQKHCKAWTDY